ncbi:MAG: ThuA domain-containing protein [Bryobacteraceae bacterium]
MTLKGLRFQWLAGAGACLCVGAVVVLLAQPPQGQPAQAGRGGGRGGVAASLFPMVDVNKDGELTRDELKAAFAQWLAEADTGKTGAITAEQLGGVLNAALPRPATGAGRGPQPQTPKPEDVQKMMAALPDKAPAKPLHPRRVLVLCKANGYVHSSIPLAAKTVEALGTKAGAWTTTVTYDPADITTQNLKQYDLVFLDSTTGAFLDDPNDASVTEARKKALLDFVRSGKGLAGIHAATDSYHQAGGARGGFGPGTTLAMQMVSAGDKNNDQKLGREELNALADSWFDELDPQKTGRVSQQDFTARFAGVMPAVSGAGRGMAGRQGRDTQVGTWPEFNKMIGGFFKFHWVYPQLITVKIDDPKSPLTAMFHNEEFQIHDETYTFGMDTWSRRNLHILTSIDYAKMSDADKAKEDYPRADHDYGLSWVHREGKGRVFYEAHGHNESIYAMTPMLEHVLAGVQYALGDLKADDAPSAK